MEFNKQFLIMAVTILILLVLLANKCEREKPGKIVETVTDTVKSTTIDTIWYDSVVVRTETKYKTVTIYDFPEDGTQVYRYVTEIDDSLISGNIVTGIEKSDSNLTLITQYIDYTPKFPQYIYRTDSIIVTNDNFIEAPPKLKLAVGINTLFSQTNYGIGPSLELQVKNKFNINGGYDLINKGITFGVHVPIFK